MLGFFELIQKGMFMEEIIKRFEIITYNKRGEKSPADLKKSKLLRFESRSVSF